MSWSTNYYEEEREIAIARRGEAMELVGQGVDHREVMLQIYDDKLKGHQRSLKLHAYRDVGRLDVPTLLHSLTVIELYPVTSNEQFAAVMGNCSLDDIEWLYEIGFLFPVIQDPRQYEGTMLEDLVRKHRFPSYEVRDRAFYDAISGDRYGEYRERAMNHPVIARAPELDTRREPAEYDNIMETGDRKIVRRYAARIAALCCLSEKPEAILTFLDDIDPANRQACREAINQIFDLHLLYVHPTSNGLLGQPHETVATFPQGYDWGEPPVFVPSWETTLRESILGTISMHEGGGIDRWLIKEAHKIGLSEAYDTALCVLQQRVSRKGIPEATINEAIDSLQARLDRYRELYYQTRGRYGTFARLGLGLAVGIGSGVAELYAGVPHPLSELIAGGLGIASAAMPDIPQTLRRAITLAKRRDPLLRHYWKVLEATEGLAIRRMTRVG